MIERLPEKLSLTQKTLVKSTKEIKSNPLLLNTVQQMLSRCDTETQEHSQRVANKMLFMLNKLSKKISLKMPSEDLLYPTMLIHDIGKSLVPKEILFAPRKLNTEEQVMAQKHVLHGQALLQKMLAYLPANLREKVKPTMEALITEHHEHYDGQGYPNGKKGQEISPWGRLIAIVDVQDALANSRSYKLAWTPQAIDDYLVQSKGKQFDPELVDQTRDLFRALGPTGNL